MDISYRESHEGKQASVLESAPSDIKLSPNVLFLGDKRSQQGDQCGTASEVPFSYNGVSAVKSDDQPPSSWHSGANESSRGSDDGDIIDQCMTDARTSGGRHVCTVCGTSFTMLGNLNRHKKSHMNVRPYNCNFCTRGFLRRTSYVEHVRLHTGEKPYSCLACGQSFVRKKCFQTHARCCPGGGDACLGLSLSSVSAALGQQAVGESAVQCRKELSTVPRDIAENRSKAGTAIVVDRPPLTSSVIHPDARHVMPSAAMYGSGRTFGTKSLGRCHQAGIGRTSFSIMKKARSTQLSRWKKHCGLMRQLTPAANSGHGSAAGILGNQGLSRRAVVEGHRRPALQVQPEGHSSSKAEHLGTRLIEQLPGESSSRSLYVEPAPAATLSPNRAGAGSSSSTPCCPSAEQPAAGAGRRSASPSAMQTLLCSPSVAATIPQRSPSLAIAAAPAMLAQASICSPSASGGRVASPLRSVSNDSLMPFASLPRDAKLFHCRHCDIYFANLVTFLLHRGLHGEGDPLKCSICGKVCRDANEFLIHH